MAADRPALLPHSLITDERGDYLRRVCSLLWPEPTSVAFTRVGGDPRSRRPRTGRRLRPGSRATDFIVLPGHGKPRLIVPANNRIATAAVGSYGEPGSRLASLRKQAMRRAMASRTTAFLCRDRLRIDVPEGASTITSYLEAALGRDLQLSMYVSASRANRKPVLQLLSPEGGVLGFAKIGIDPLTCQLVRAERSALLRLATVRLSNLIVPEVLHSGCWNGLELLVLRPLPVWLRRRRLPPPRLVSAMREVAEVGGLTRQPLTAAEHWHRLHGRVLSRRPHPQAAALASALGILGDQAAEAALCYGAWHGDWTPWNMASTEQGILVWDWERFAATAPLGFDALHHWLQTAVGPRRQEPRLAANRLVDRAGELLLPFGVGAAEARWTALLYLAELAARYLVDRQDEAGARLGDPGWWLLPAINGALPA